MKTILMVCLGNICRSPLAEAILRAKIGDREIKVDSAGTGDFHIGDRPDKRARLVAEKHNISTEGIFCRQFQESDFDNFDEIYAMDPDNYNKLMDLARNNKDQYKVELILNLLEPGANRGVPDPYYGTEEDFERVFELLDKATDVIIQKYDSERA
ncbi:low molecular weight phosphotyrosine protein phosphatase [Ornithobacterium rhinotracheale]|uniref:protein-tyrosine-phosphatase n=1 Tax=Ornithobacterium rhinotracheale TaxID=28251 RepID=A0A3R5UXM0_ORNRH|nr:low molecular weight protein-tyrosine-phosphatase [Ornithobacterium rhinotracheale]QAR30811.1 low molecular weight phosphotyrosine protein phosphatase [Ornithobacterium rhinotracheale]